MANYCCAIRTNYFHVKDEEKFRELMSRVCGSEDSVELWEETDSDGGTLFGFGVYGGIAGLIPNDDEDDEEADYDKFIDELQASVADDDAIIIFESGNEKLRYLVGIATIITSKYSKCLDIGNCAVKQAGNMLGKDSWHTEYMY